jgi:recombination protein RecR
MSQNHIQNLIAHFSSLPGIGQKTAERLVFYLLKQDRAILSDFAESLMQAKNNIRDCAKCGQFTETEFCAICSDAKRDQNLICVVAENSDIAPLEKAGQFNGVYHILNGLLNPIEAITPDKLNIKKLEERIKINSLREIILAINPTIEGETTCLYLTKLIKKLAPQIKVTKLARGLPQGGDLEYADEITLSNALRDRTIV